MDEARESAAPQTDTGSTKNGAARGENKSAVGRGRAVTGKQNDVQADSSKAAQAKPKPGEQTTKDPGKNESFEYETDCDSDRKQHPGWKNTRNPPTRKVVDKDNQGVTDRDARQAARVARANSEVTAGTARPTATRSERRGRTKSVPLATTSVSATASPVSKSSGKRKAVDDVESNDDK